MGKKNNIKVIVKKIVSFTVAASLVMTALPCVEGFFA